MGPIGSDPAAGHDAMQMRMMEQVLSPRMKHREKAYFCTEMSGIGSNSSKGLGGGAKEDIVDHVLVLIGDSSNFLGQGKNEVKIADREKLCLAVLEPAGTGKRLAFGAVSISTGIVSRSYVTAGVAPFQVAAEGDGTAAFNSAHYAPLSVREGSCVLLPILRAIAAENIRHLELRTLHRSAVSEMLTAAGEDPKDW